MTDTRCPSLFIYLQQLSAAARFCLLDHVLLTHGEMRHTGSDFKYISPPWKFKEHANAVLAESETVFVFGRMVLFWDLLCKASIEHSRHRLS